jgi:hypothetical protein
MDFMLDSIYNFMTEFTQLSRKHPNNQEYVYLKTAAASSWAKCEKYYKLADEVPAYYAAEILQPSRKLNWITESWATNPEKQAWLSKPKAAVRELWEEEYKGKYALKSVDKPSEERPRHSDDEFGALHEHARIKSTIPIIADNFQAYIESDIEEADPLIYWNARHIFQPDLTRMALDMLAISMMSAECERIFSSAKLLITNTRSRLLPDIIEASECLKAWLSEERKRTTFDEDVDDNENDVNSL